MSSIRTISKFFKLIQTHPLTKNSKFNAILRLLKWQFVANFSNGFIKVPFIENTHLFLKKRLTGGTGNIYVGLLEFEEMMFLLHYLRKDSIFFDIGANIGVFSILASGVIKAKSHAFEPVKSTYDILNTNITGNDLHDLVNIYQLGVGEKNQELEITNTIDSCNHISYSEKNANTETINVITLDDFLKDVNPNLIKIDVEGFEHHVLKGAKQILLKPELNALIVELNGLGKQYGFSDKQSHEIILASGFKPVKYDPFTRSFETLSNFISGANQIYIKDIEYVQSMVKAQRKMRVLNNYI